MKALSLTLGEAPLLQIPQTRVLDQQVLHRYGEQTVLAVQSYISKYGVGESAETQPQMGHGCLLPAVTFDMRVQPEMSSHLW